MISELLNEKFGILLGDYSKKELPNHEEIDREATLIYNAYSYGDKEKCAQYIKANLAIVRDIAEYAGDCIELLHELNPIVPNREATKNLIEEREFFKLLKEELLTEIARKKNLKKLPSVKLAEAV